MNGYRPRREPESLAREVVGRAAIALMGIALLWGSYRCFRAGADIQRDVSERAAARVDRPRAGGSGAPVFFGVVLALFGGPLALAAVVPVSVMEKLLGPQRNTTLWENPDVQTPLRSWADVF